MTSVSFPSRLLACMLTVAAAAAPVCAQLSIQIGPNGQPQIQGGQPAPQAAQQQPPSISATLTPAVVGAGQASEFVITLDGAQSVQVPPQPIVVEGLEIQGPGQSQEFSSVNGITRIRYSFHYQVFAAKPGSYTIPPQSITFNGQPFTTPQRTLQVQDSPTNPNQGTEPFLKLNLAKTDLYVGELIPLTLTGYFHRQTQLQNYEFPKLPRDNFVVKRFARSPSASSVEVNGQQFQALSFDSTLAPLKEGDFDLGPATIDCQVGFPSANPTRANNPFNNFFNGGMSTRQVNLKSEPVKVHVKPLPAEGRPADFSGAVGRFNVQVRANPTQLKVNDPIAVDLEITGQGNFDYLSAPLLSATDGWLVYPAKQTVENRASGLDPGSVSYTQAVTPKKLMTELPSFIFSFFDPDQQKYVTVSTQPIPLRMTPEDKPAGGAGPAARDFSTSEALPPEEILADILAHPRIPTAAALLPVQPSGDADRIFWGLQLVPAALLIAFIAVGLQRRLRAQADEHQRRTAGQPRPVREVMRELNNPDLKSREFYSLARECVQSIAFHLQRSVEGEPSVSTILTRQAQLCYSGSNPQADMPLPAPERSEVLDSLTRLGA